MKTPIFTVTALCIEIGDVFGARSFLSFDAAQRFMSACWDYEDTRHPDSAPDYKKEQWAQNHPMGPLVGRDVCRYGLVQSTLE